MTAAATSAMTTTATIAALRALFVARQLAITVGVDARKLRSAASVELGTRDRAVIVGVGLKEMVAATALRTVSVLRDSQTSRTSQSRQTSGGEQELTH